MIDRINYIQELYMWRDERVIKVITGMRRCGKSTLMQQYQDKLVSEGVDRANIIYINFEELEFERLLDYKKLHDYIMEKVNPNSKNYVFLDEVQRVKEYEKAVDSLYIKDYIDIYITGSNSYMLSSDLATFLSGRYIEIKMLPLSFSEFYSVKKGEKEKAFYDYLKYGGLPYIATMINQEEKYETYIEGIYNTVIIRDVEERQSRIDNGDGKRINDIALLKTVSRYLSSTTGSLVSVRNVTNYLISTGRKVSPNTINNYIEALCEAFVFYEANRFDISGKSILKNNKKLYIVDLGLRNYVLPKQTYDLGFSIENIVFLELLRRGYKVYVGKIGGSEIDFVAKKNNDYTYIQVTANMVDESTFKREMSPLQNISDNYQKIVLTLDRYTIGNYDGIYVKNVVDWLLDT